MEEEKKDNKRKALIKLLLWLLFLGIVLIISSVGNKDKSSDNLKKDNEKKVVTYEDKLDKLNDNFTYKYTITINNLVYNYEGKIMGKEEAGIYKVNESTINYYKNKGYIYQVVDGNLNKIDNLYLNVSQNYLDVSYLKELIKDKKYALNNGVYEYTLDIGNIKINVDDENIKNIELKENDNIYLLEFSDIGMIKEISY